MLISLAVVMLVSCHMTLVSGHGRMMWPTSRSSMWRFGYDVPQNWNDAELFCGGFDYQWNQHDGKCGICGDPWAGERENEAGGIYASGIISGHFTPGQEVEFMLHIVANHHGWNEFRICPNNDVNTPATQECFDEYLLEMADGSGTRWDMPLDAGGDITVTMKLPEGLTCDQCVVQWLWVCGNRNQCSDDCPLPGGCGMGCGPQETFMGCADISIHD